MMTCDLAVEQWHEQVTPLILTFNEEANIDLLSKVSPVQAANYAQTTLELLQNFFLAPVNVRHVFIKL